MSRPRRGEIWWSEDLDKRRPVLVMTRDAAVPVLRTVTVAPLSRRVRGIPTEVELDEGDGVPAHCAIKLDGLTQVPTWSLTERVAGLDAMRLRAVCAALHAALDC